MRDTHTSVFESQYHKCSCVCTVHNCVLIYSYCAYMRPRGTVVLRRAGGSTYNASACRVPARRPVAPCRADGSAHNASACRVPARRPVAPCRAGGSVFLCRVEASWLLSFFDLLCCACCSSSIYSRFSDLFSRRSVPIFLVRLLYLFRIKHAERPDLSAMYGRSNGVTLDRISCPGWHSHTR